MEDLDKPWAKAPVQLLMQALSGAPTLGLCCAQAALREMLTILTAAPAPPPAGVPRSKGASSPRAALGSPGVGRKGDSASEVAEGAQVAEGVGGPDAAESKKWFPLLDAAFMLKLPVATPLMQQPQHK